MIWPRGYQLELVVDQEPILETHHLKYVFWMLCVIRRHVIEAEKLKIDQCLKKNNGFPVLDSGSIIFSLMLMGSTAGEGLYLNQMADVGFRKDFPETWIWLDANMRYGEKYVCH